MQFPFRYHNQPHPLGRLVLVVPVELWRPQEGLKEDGQEAYALHIERDVNESVGDRANHHTKRKQKLHVAAKVCPLPEVAPVKVCIYREG